MIHLYLYDTETTGANVERDRIVQLAAMHVKLEEKGTGALQMSAPVVAMNTYCNPGRPIEQGATEVHGIKDEHVTMSPPDTLMVLAMLNQIFALQKSGPVILVGHNIERFDTPIITRVAGYDFGKEFSSIDTYTIALREWPQMPHKLEQLYDWYAHGEKVSAHDAAADCWMVSRFLVNYFAEKEIASEERIEELVDWLETPQLLTHFPWGKHKGVPVDDVPDNYYQWCARNYTEVHKDVEFTICNKLGIDELCA